MVLISFGVSFGGRPRGAASSAASQAFAVLGFPYASGTQSLEILCARVRKPDGKLVDTPAGDVQDQPAQATQIAPMYNDLHI